MTDTIGFWIVLVGVLFDLFGCIGLVRLPDVFNRLQAATKCVTLGTCMILFGVLVITGFGATGIKALLCAAFILLTSPVGAHALARAAHRAGIKMYEGTVVDRYSELDRHIKPEGGSHEETETTRIG